MLSLNKPPPLLFQMLPCILHLMHSCIPAQMEYHPTLPMLQNRTLIKKSYNQFLAGGKEHMRITCDFSRINLLFECESGNVIIVVPSYLHSYYIYLHIRRFLDKKRFDHDWILKIPPSNGQQGNHDLDGINRQWCNLSF